MINSLKLTNYKAFESQLLEFKPLTLLSGLNSTGKSSVLQSLLLLRQSYQQELLPNVGLALNGELVRIGNAQDAFCERAKEDYLGFEIIWNNDKKGEYTAHFLAINQDKDVLQSKLRHPMAKSNALSSQVEGWMREVSPGTRIKINSNSDIGLMSLQYFYGVEFCEDVGKQMQNLYSGNPMLRQVIKRLFELEDYCKIWTNGAFNSDNIPSKATPESESRLRHFKQELTFKCPDGEKRIFSWHLRMTGAGAWRLHFSEELGPGKIIIGYIGSKIE